QADAPHGYLVLLSRDRLATVRRAPSTDEMLKAGAQLIGGALASQRLIAELENSNRLLSALGDMTAEMLKPGAGRHQVIDAVVGHLTDSEVPEFDFNFATVYLLEEREDEATVVKMAAGAATTTAIDAADTRSSAHAGKRVPRWAMDEDRVLSHEDVLVYVATNWQTVIVGPMPSTDHADVVSGGIPVASTWTEVPVVYANGMVLGNVLACLIGEKERGHAADGPPFTLAGEVLERGGHKDLVRIFVPFGSDQSRRATGVLEVGYHRSDQRRPDWGQVEALRAAAGQLPVVIDDTSANSQVDPAYVKAFGVKSLMALPLMVDEQAIGAAILAERNRNRRFTPEEVQRAQALAVQAAVAIKNARLHALAEEE